VPGICDPARAIKTGLATTSLFMNMGPCRHVRSALTLWVAVDSNHLPPRAPEPNAVTLATQSREIPEP